MDEFGRSVGEEMLSPPGSTSGRCGDALRGPRRSTVYTTSPEKGSSTWNRGERPLGFDLEYLPEPQPIFQVIAKRVTASAAEIPRVQYGVGFIVLPESAGAGRRHRQRVRHHHLHPGPRGGGRTEACSPACITWWRRVLAV